MPAQGSCSARRSCASAAAAGWGAGVRSPARNSRSARVTRGLSICCCRMASWWRIARISMSFALSLIGSSRMKAMRLHGSDWHLGLDAVRAAVSPRKHCLTADGRVFPGAVSRAARSSSSVFCGAGRPCAREGWEPFAGARVHARLVTSFELAMADVILANGAGCYPLCAAAGILKYPLGKVKIEGPHFGQGFAKVDSRHRDHGPVAGPRRDRFGLATPVQSGRFPGTSSHLEKSRASASAA